MSTSPQLLDKYELRECLGQTDRTEVWKAFDPQEQRYVVIKILHANIQADPDFPARFIREVKRISTLIHPNIVRIRDFGSTGSSELTNIRAYLVTDYVEGQTLADYIHKTSHQGKFPSAAEIIHLLIPISLAIDYAHQNGMVHSDLKPTNILLDKSNTSINLMGQPILSDFGMVDMLRTPDQPFSLANPFYTSPEQAQGYPGNERSDLYSFGVILYELFTGVLPFQGNDPTDIMMQHIHAIPASPVLTNPNILPALTLVILRNLAKNPAERFPSAATLVAAMAQAINLPVVGHLGSANTPADPMNMPTHHNPLSPTRLPGMIPSPPSWPGIAPASPITPPVSPPYPQPTPGKQRRKGLYAALIVALIVILVGSGVGALFLLKRFITVPSTPTSSIVGQAFFVSSGLLRLNGNNVGGITDGFQINLQGISPPQQGNSYYAWLMSNTTGNPAIPLGTINQGTVMLSYQPPSHNNLLANYSRFLITEEPTATPRLLPSLDKNTWRYGASFSTMGNSKDNANHYSLYQHLMHLLASDPKLNGVDLHGGLDINLYINTTKVLEAAGAARDAQNRCTAAPNNPDCAFVLREIGRILGYLDGRIAVHTDVPASLQLDPTLPPVALIDFNGVNQVPPYLEHIGSHLSFMISSPGVTQDQMALAIQITQDINNVQMWLTAVHDDAKMLVNMNNAQLSQLAALQILDHLLTYARYAFTGQFNPDTSKTLEGVAQIHYDIQKLATFDVMPCTITNGQSSCA